MDLERKIAELKASKQRKLEKIDKIRGQHNNWKYSATQRAKTRALAKIERDKIAEANRLARKVKYDEYKAKQNRELSFLLTASLSVPKMPLRVIRDLYNKEFSKSVTIEAIRQRLKHYGYTR